MNFFLFSPKKKKISFDFYDEQKKAGTKPTARRRRSPAAVTSSAATTAASHAPWQRIDRRGATVTTRPSSSSTSLNTQPYVSSSFFVVVYIVFSVSETKQNKHIFKFVSPLIRLNVAPITSTRSPYQHAPPPNNLWTPQLVKVCACVLFGIFSSILLPPKDVLQSTIAQRANPMVRQVTTRAGVRGSFVDVSSIDCCFFSKKKIENFEFCFVGFYV